MEEIYWITRIESINVFFGFLIAISIAGVIVSLICLSIYMSDKGKKNTRRCLVTFIILGFLFGIIEVFMPSQKEVLIIYEVGNLMKQTKEGKTSLQISEKDRKIIDYLYQDMFQVEFKEN